MNRRRALAALVGAPAAIAAAPRARVFRSLPLRDAALFHPTVFTKAQVAAICCVPYHALRGRTAFAQVEAAAQLEFAQGLVAGHIICLSRFAELTRKGRPYFPKESH